MKKLLFVFSLFTCCLTAQNNTKKAAFVNCKDIEFFYLFEGILSKVSLPVYEVDTLDSLSKRLKVELPYSFGRFRFCKLLNKSENVEEKVFPIYLNSNESIYKFCSKFSAIFLDDLLVKIDEDAFFEEIKKQIEAQNICVRTGFFNDSLYFSVDSSLQNILDGVAEFEGSGNYNLVCTNNVYANSLEKPVCVKNENYFYLSRLVTGGLFKFFAKEDK